MTAVSKPTQRLIVSVAAAALLGFGVTPTPALAGFEWTPPPAEAPAEQPSSMAAPVAPVESDLSGPLTPSPDAPAPVEAAAEPVATAADLPVPGEAGLKSLPAAPAQEPVKEDVAWGENEQAPAPLREAAPQSVTPVAQPKAPVDLDMTPVQGFGKDIPLAIALRQIAPPTYAYRFADGVMAGQRVSWQGGKPWPHVLSDMLSANGLQVVIIDNVISVQRAGQSAEAPLEASSEPKVAALSVSEATGEAASLEEPAATSANENAEPAPDIPAAEVAAPAPVKDEPVARTAYVPGSASAPSATAAPMSIQTEAQAAEAGEIKVAEVSPAPQPASPVVATASAGKTVPVVDLGSPQRWEAEPGRTLRETLEKWSGSAGAEVEWMSPYDYPVEHSFVYNGKFDDAVESLLALYSRETPRPRGRLYPNLPSGPSVLMIN